MAGWIAGLVHLAQSDNKEVEMRAIESIERAASAPPTAATDASAGITPLREFLAFKLGAEEYGIDILCVQEIRSYEEPTRIANAPAIIKGVVNLRGVIA